MIRKILLTGWYLLPAVLPVVGQIPAIGNWRDHLPYHQAIGVVTAGVAGDKIYCATPYSLFLVDPADKHMDRLSKTNGLSETGISAICYDAQKDKLTIAYTTSNIDIISGSHTYNIPVIKGAALTADKTIHQATAIDGQVYLSTGLGVIVLDEDKYEVKDTYIIGDGGDTVAVQAVATDGQYLYAATAKGLRRAAVASPDLADYHNWVLMPAAGEGPCRQVINADGKILVLQHDSVFTVNDSSRSLFYADGWTINDLTPSGGKILISGQQGDSGRVLILAGTGLIERTLQQGGVLQSPRQALTEGGQVWVADAVTGLSAWAATGSGGPEMYTPNSPLSLASGEMTIARGTASADTKGGVLWVASGGVDSNWAPLNNHNGIYRLEGGDWTNYNGSVFPVFDTCFDLMTVAVDPRDSSLFAGSFGEGLLERRAGDVFTRYTAANSAIGPFQGDPSSYRVSGAAVDASGNCWLANYGAADELVLRLTDGSWHSFAVPFTHTDHAVAQVLLDNYKHVWLVSPKGNGVFCYGPGALLADASDDQWAYYRAGATQGNLPDNNVFCLALDKSGFVWVGTANGIGVVQCTQNVFKAGGCAAIWPVVQFDQFAGYLFSGQAVQTIAVDGADRKWIGTRNGVWLISADAQKIIYHFTEDDSPLLSNDVKKIVVDPQTGEVFFSTAKGICSFRGTATEGGEKNTNVLVFPNPVPPGYTGTIAIRGLVDGAIVKIAELSGRLVYQTNALGGQAIWNGRDYKGRQAATGVYLVLVSDETHQEKIVTKIVFVGK